MNLWAFFSGIASWFGNLSDVFKAALITAVVSLIGIVGQWCIASGNSKRAERAEERADNAEKRADAAERRAVAAERRETDAIRNKELSDFATFFKSYTILATKVFNTNLRIGEYLAKQLSYMDAYAEKEVPFDQHFVDAVSRLNGAVENIRSSSSKTRYDLIQKRDAGLIMYRTFSKEIQEVFSCANFFPDEVPPQLDFFGATRVSPYVKTILTNYDGHIWQKVLEERADEKNWDESELLWKRFIQDNFSIEGIEIVKTKSELAKRFNASVAALRDCIEKEN
ncbi:hypothetical protein CSQ87_07600 [Bifidobacterium simiarum]|uniref:Uncharacterized protein n=2 Tax=Bifidobacterium simiarum TaxID=2045441 RepID=A0A2M9HE47_9BIFI|nr:hypothetical protein CSQ87_07600 [Bifidobacterium simiarum]